MELVRSSLDSSMVFLALMTLAAALLSTRAVPEPYKLSRPSSQEVGEFFGASGLAFLGSVLLTGDFLNQLPVVALTLLASAVVRCCVNRLSMPGILWLTVQPIALAVSVVWGYRFVTEAQMPLWVEMLALAGIGSSLISFGIGFAERFAREAVLTHEQWRRPISAPPVSPDRPHIKVSVQLPCYAEPPEVVKATMDRLAALDYDNFEVLVCDNNTRDERLWRPLEDHCQRLNSRLGREVFRFFHVAPLAGAKAGALNYCLEAMAPDAELVAVIDADYYARRDFLSRLVTFFDDPTVAYVQTPHDYRDHENSDYLTSCYWEYMPNNKVDMPGVGEYGGAFTIGTMCILRTEALREIGGWAEWCLTEDSEISVRLRAAGYHGFYLGETFGRGLIPETFDDYKKQRFRWTAGPVQQLRRYWRIFLPAPFAPPLPGWTKLLETLRCIAPLKTLFGMICALFGMAALGVALLTKTMQPIDIPNVAWLVLPLGAATSVVRTWHRYRLSGCTSILGMVRGEMARMSLFYIVLVAGVAGLSSKPLAWRRTPKFAIGGAEESPFVSTMPETVAGSVCLFMGLLALAGMPVLGSEMALLCCIGAGSLAFRFWCAPYMAWLAIRHARAIGQSDAPSPEMVPLTAS